MGSGLWALAPGVEHTQKVSPETRDDSVNVSTEYEHPKVNKSGYTKKMSKNDSSVSSAAGLSKIDRESPEPKGFEPGGQKFPESIPRGQGRYCNR